MEEGGSRVGEAVDPVEDATVTRDQPAGVLHPEIALHRRQRDVPEEAGDASPPSAVGLPPLPPLTPKEDVAKPAPAPAKKGPGYSILIIEGDKQRSVPITVAPDVQRSEVRPDDANKDGISCKPNWVWSKEHSKVMLGRFGWKAGVPTINQQTAEAASGDIGLSTSLLRTPSGDCTEKQEMCLKAPNGNSPKYQDAELGDDLFKLISFYSHNLAVPPRRDPGNPEVLKGKGLFYSIGCASCHKPKFVTGELPGQPHLSHQLIWPYTDLLLHDMGEGLADNRPEGEASGSEWRTAPLWGIGLTETVNGHTLFLHDGRARNITEAILWHGGEAQASRDKFANLSKKDRKRLIAFVNSL